MKQMRKECPVCGKMFDAIVHYKGGSSYERKTCSTKCTRTLNKKIAEVAEEIKTRKPKRPTLDEKIAAAEKKGVSYGQYMAAQYLKTLPKVGS